MPSIAVLPFNIYTKTPEYEYLGESVADEIIYSLSDIEGLNVIARSSSFAFKNINDDLIAIAKQYNIDCFLEGSITLFNSNARVSIKLIDSQSGNLFLKNSFEVGVLDILKLHDTICLKVAEHVRENFGHFLIYDEKLKKNIPSLAVYSLFLKGKSMQNQWTEQGLRAAIEFYDLCIHHDPSFVRPYYGKVQSYGLLAAWGYMDKEDGFAKAVEAFSIAQDMDKTLPDYYLSLIGRSFWQEWNFPLAYQQLTESLTEHPNFTNSLEAMGELLMHNGYFKEAEQHLTYLVKLDPISPNNHFTLATCYYLQGEYEKSEASIQKSLLVSGSFMPALVLNIFCQILQNKFDVNTKSQIESGYYEKLIYLDQLINKKSTDEQHDRHVEEIIKQDVEDYYPISLYLAVARGSLQYAYELLTNYVENKLGQVLPMKVDPFLKPLREKYEIENLHTHWLTEHDIAMAKPQNQKSIVEEEEKSKIKSQLIQVIESEKEYLNADLTLRGLAEKLNIQPNKLSFVVNREFGKNFNEFLNQYRLEHFKSLVHEGKVVNYSILGMAYDSGFNSKSVFNNFFKKQMQVSPKDWLKQKRGTEL